MNIIKKLLPLVLLAALIFSSCKKDQLLTDSGAKLSFSTDSILFDTVFTQVGSTTKVFRIYNNHSQPMNISRIHLGGGTSSPFRINIDGVSGTSITDIDIMGGDSLYAFVQVTVNPTNQNSPLLIKDSIIFETNGNSQYVNLTAIGQDVYLHKPTFFPTNGFPPFSVISCKSAAGSTWRNDKPHLIFGYAIVDQGCTLTMLAGTRVYLHKNAVLMVYKDATLKVLGEHNNEVTFEGDRLEADYKEIPGQWGKVWLSKGSKNNYFNWAKMKNGSIGIQVDSSVNSGEPTLQIDNTIIRNMKAAALFSQTGHIRSYNCLFANCGQYLAALTIGGQYRFEQCTFANFWDTNPNNGTGGSSATRSTPSVILNNFYIDGNNVEHVYPFDSTAYFYNCIIYGDVADEMVLDSSTLVPGNNLPYYFDHCLLRDSSITATSIAAHSSPLGTMLFNQDPQFKDVGNNNYNLNATSPVIGQGNTAFVLYLFYDLNTIQRNNPPALGAYEYHP